MMRTGAVAALTILCAMPGCASDDGAGAEDENLRGGHIANAPALMAVGALGPVNETGELIVSCTGTLIDAKTVITAKHCVTTDPEGGTLDRVTQGLWFGVGLQAKSAVLYKVVSAVVPAYREGGFIFYGSDIALLTLEKAPRDVTPLTVAQGHLSVVPEKLTVVGYGFDDRDKNGVRRKGNMTLRASTGQSARAVWSNREQLDRAVMEREHLAQPFAADDDRTAQIARFYEHTLLSQAEAYFGAPGDAQPCRADSGGPVLRGTTVVGVVSASLKLSTSPCGNYGAFVATIGPDAALLLTSRAKGTK
jgi:hypothetical protein